jgi:hypothetical protein
MGAGMRANLPALGAYVHPVARWHFYWMNHMGTKCPHCYSAQLQAAYIQRAFSVSTSSAGSLALAISLPTMLVGLARYSRDQGFGVLGANSAFALAMAAGSIIGTLVGTLLLPIVSEASCCRS